MNLKKRMLTGLAVGILGACSSQSTPPATQMASQVAAPAPSLGVEIAKADVMNTKGESIGTVTLFKDADKTHVVADLKGLTPGMHGFHIHAVGKCNKPKFTKAGGHLSAKGQKHGFDSKGGPHEGDIPNLEVAADGTVKKTFDLTNLKLDDKGAPVLDRDGAAVIIHAKPDDNKSQPSGNSGDRAACGVFTAAAKG